MSRRLLFTAILLAVSCLSPREILAQEPADGPDPVKWSLKASPPDAAKTVLLELTAQIQNGWHLYSTERVEGGPSPTRITLAPGQSFEISGEIVSPAPRSAYDPNFQVATESYEGAVTFRMAAKAQAPTLPEKITVLVRYQTCTATICLPPKLLELAVSLNGETKPDVATTAAEPESKATLPGAGAVIADFDFTDFAGRPRRFSEFRGRVVLLDFWASWCSPCLADIPELKRIHQKFHSQGFEILGMDSETLGQKDDDPAFLKEAQANARLILKSRGVSWPQSANETSLPVARRFGIESLPAKILIDRDGRFIAKISKLSELEALLHTLLKK